MYLDLVTMYSLGVKDYIQRMVIRWPEKEFSFTSVGQHIVFGLLGYTLIVNSTHELLLRTFEVVTWTMGTGWHRMAQDGTGTGFLWYRRSPFLRYWGGSYIGPAVSVGRNS